MINLRALSIISLALFLGLAWFGPAQARPPRLSVMAPTPELGAEVRQVVNETADRLEKLTGGAPAKIKVIVAATGKDFSRRARRLGGPSWAAGLAVPRSGLILVRSPGQLTRPGEFRFLLIHELVHLYLAAGLGSKRPPRWLEEGLAMYASGQSGWGLTGAMTRGVLLKRLIPFSDLEHRFPEQGDQAALAYAQSYYFVSFLLANFGKDVLSRLLAELSQGRDFTTALHRVAGMGQVAVQKQFSDEMSSRFSWLALGAASGTIWAVIALAAAAMLLWRRRSQLQARKLIDLETHEEAGALRNWPPPRPRGDVLGAAGLRDDAGGAQEDEKVSGPGSG